MFVEFVENFKEEGFCVVWFVVLFGRLKYWFVCDFKWEIYVNGCFWKLVFVLIFFVSYYFYYCVIFFFYWGDYERSFDSNGVLSNIKVIIVYFYIVISIV